jgi:cytochrome c biogenesis protein CcdA
MFDRKLLTKLSPCAWKVLRLYLSRSPSEQRSKPLDQVVCHFQSIILVGFLYESA